MGTKNFIDLFAGCGGLSLGLIKSGWKGVFAIEKTPDAFTTLKHNLIDGKQRGFDWPKWLPCKEVTTSELLNDYSSELQCLQGKIDLIAGGPPCQGFSFAGRRNPSDPRNKLTEEYIELVNIIRPKYLLLENVKGF
ncbi:MAG: DNA cytosine methyltransferase [Robiginitomaculum sp.]|nr:DNA cytosine methyltransferase [Robiginitomaculum sp.]